MDLKPSFKNNLNNAKKKKRRNTEQEDSINGIESQKINQDSHQEIISQFDNGSNQNMPQ